MQDEWLDRLIRNVYATVEDELVCSELFVRLTQLVELRLTSRELT